MRHKKRNSLKIMLHWINYFKQTMNNCIGICKELLYIIVANWAANLGKVLTLAYIQSSSNNFFRPTKNKQILIFIKTEQKLKIFKIIKIHVLKKLILHYKYFGSN